jgi:hypothetical protein
MSNLGIERVENSLQPILFPLYPNVRAQKLSEKNTGLVANRDLAAGEIILFWNLLNAMWEKFKIVPVSWA